MIRSRPQTQKSRAEEVDAGWRRGASEGHAARGRDGVAEERAASGKRRRLPSRGCSDVGLSSPPAGVRPSLPPCSSSGLQAGSLHTRGAQGRQPATEELEDISQFVEETPAQVGGEGSIESHIRLNGGIPRSSAMTVPSVDQHTCYTEFL